MPNVSWKFSFTCTTNYSWLPTICSLLPSYCGTVGLLFLYCWPPPYTVGLLPMLLVFSSTDFMEACQGSSLKGVSFEQSIFKSHGNPSNSSTVALLHALLAFSPTVYYLKEVSHWSYDRLSGDCWITCNLLQHAVRHEMLRKSYQSGPV